MAKISVTKLVPQTVVGRADTDFDDEVSRQWNSLNADFARAGEKTYQQNAPITDLNVEYEEISGGIVRQKVSFTTFDGLEVGLFILKNPAHVKNGIKVEIKNPSEDTSEMCNVDGLGNAWSTMGTKSLGTRRARAVQKFASDILNSEALRLVLVNSALKLQR